MVRAEREPLVGRRGPRSGPALEGRSHGPGPRRLARSVRLWSKSIVAALMTLAAASHGLPAAESSGRSPAGSYAQKPSPSSVSADSRPAGGEAAASPSSPATDSTAPPLAFPGERGRLRGEVSFSRQEPAVGAVVVLVRDGDPEKLAIGTTDRDGYFRFESIPGGTYTVGVLREGAEPLIKGGIVVKPPMRAVVDLILKKQTGPWVPPPVDLARFEAGDTGGAASPGAPSAPDGVAAGSAQPRLKLRVLDPELRPIREVLISLRSRGPAVDPIRAVSGDDGSAELTMPGPGEYQFRVAAPGYLSARIDRLRLGRTPPVVFVVLTPRPLDYPASPSDLLPDEKPVPPAGFPGAR